jgi:hypothetical protein
MLLIEVPFCLTVETAGLQCLVGMPLSNEFGRGHPTRISLPKQVIPLLDCSLCFEVFHQNPWPLLTSLVSRDWHFFVMLFIRSSEAFSPLIARYPAFGRTEHAVQSMNGASS